MPAHCIVICLPFLAINQPLLLHPPAIAAQDIDFSVGRRADEERYDLDVGQRVLVSVPPERMMAFDYPDIDGTAVAV